jgi:lysophospholipase L1-like esterase
MRLLWWVIGGVLVAGAVASVAGAGPASLPSKEPAKVKPLLGRSAQILLIGDSISAGDGTAGGRLQKKLEKAGFTVTRNALGGRSANTFIAGTKKLKEPKKGLDQLQDAIDAGPPKISIIFLGTNDLAGLSIGNKIGPTKTNFDKIRNKLEGAGVRVIGIGSPHYKERPKFHKHEATLRDALLDVYGVDNFVDAGPITGSYKMHAGGKSAQEFADRLYAELSNIL